jgi:glycerol kinase
MASNDWLMQTLADQLRVTVERPAVLETTAWGAARLAGLQAGVYPALGASGLRRVERAFAPAAPRELGDALHAGWVKAVGRVRTSGT